MSSVLVIDVGTSSLRAAIVAADGTVGHVHQRRTPPAIPFPGLVEFDAARLAADVLELARAALDAGGPVAAVGIANQRSSTIVWDRATGEPVGPALGWQDLRTVGACLSLRAEYGLSLAPNQSATKLGWLLDTFDPGRDRDLCFGTVDTWVAWTLSEGRLHVTDETNAGVSGLVDHGLPAHPEPTAWHPGVLHALNIPERMLPMIVDSTGVLGEASALPGAPAIAGIAGDQQASLIGQGCVRPGMAKLTFGTGAMLDVCRGDEAPSGPERSANGTFPIVAWSAGRAITWGVEAIMLAAGTNVDWLVEDLGVIAEPAESEAVAGSVPGTDGVVYVPALLGLGTPAWDYGARGTLLGVTRGTTRAHVVRAVLEGIAQRGADLVEAAEADTGLQVPALRVDGGMSVNPVFVQAVADASGKAVEVSPVVEGTTLGAAFLAGTAVGIWTDLAEAGSTWRPARVVEPGERLDRARWAEAVSRARGWIPDLSALDF